ncbi:hypothetical protein [Peribacillus muralis]|uniref:hypothetical protein n=1 Tax=Peribacillus muralis TaxID=264697 RepID=UPI003D03758B
MVYSKTDWKDHVVDVTTGAIIQQGTPVSALNLNKMETGISEAHAQLEGAGRANQTLQHGLSVLNGINTAPVDLQIEGRTLISMGSTPLDPLKNYVLTDKKTKLKFANNTYQGVSKFNGENGKPQITRIANYEGKAAGSTLENPHTAKSNATKSDTALLMPTSASWGEFGNGYNTISKLTGVTTNVPTSANGSISQSQFSFNLIEEVERQIGRIPRLDVAGKVQWLKDNLASFRCNWHGLGSGPGGYKATLALWQRTGNSYTAAPPQSHTNGSISKLTIARLANIPENYLNTFIDVDGFVHFLAYAEPSDGVTASSINTAYTELEIELKQDAILFDPIIPLYEVPVDEYVKILVDWNEVDVLNRYPKVQGSQHLQNPVIMAEGENLLPPFYEWTFNSTAIAASKPYEITLSVTTAGSTYTVDYFLNVIPGQTFYLKADAAGSANGGVLVRSEAGASILNGVLLSNGKVAFTIPAGVNRIYVRFYNMSTAAGAITTISNPVLTLGDKEKSFVPRNPSYLFANVKLGQIGPAKDRLYKDGQDWKLRKEIEKDIVLDGSLTWGFSGDMIGCKNVYWGVPYSPVGVSSFVTKYDGRVIKNILNGSLGNPDEQGIYTTLSRQYITIADTDTGYGENYSPLPSEISAYFYGWKAKTVDANGKPTAWKSLVDGADAPTQTLAYVSTNKAPNFTPYKMSYVLTSPIIEDAADKVEGDLAVNGLTPVDVGSGFILREKANLKYNSTYDVYAINHKDLPLKNRAYDIVNVYKNGRPIGFKKYISVNAFGRTYLDVAKSDYDPAAEYTVTYLVYDRDKFTVNATNISASFANNIRGALEDVVKKGEDTATNVSINAKILYDVLIRLKAGGL